jgi:NSS family neurotransmitter:Na+ symporter
MSTSAVDEETEGWKTRSDFILATIGATIGVGSIWKFPYEMGSNGGGAFVLVYLLGLVLVVVSLMLAEFAIGNRGRGDAAKSIEAVASEEGVTRRWGLFGLLGAATSFLILTFYAVIGGWTLAYAYHTLVNGLADEPGALTSRFDDLMASLGRMSFFQVIFIVAVAMVVTRGA